MGLLLNGTLLLNGALFIPLPLNNSRKSPVNYQPNVAFVISKETHGTVARQQKPKLEQRSQILRAVPNENYTSVYFEKSKLGKNHQVQYTVIDGIVSYDIYGNSGSRDMLTSLDKQAFVYLSQLYPELIIQASPKQEFDHALNKNLGVATRSRTLLSSKKDWDPCYGTRLLKRANIAKTSKPSGSLKRESVFDYSNGDLRELLINHGERGIIYVESQFRSNRKLLSYAHQAEYQVKGMKNALESQVECIGETFLERYNIHKKDEILGLDLALVMATFAPDIQATRDFSLVSADQAEEHLIGCAQSAVFRAAFLQEGISLISKTSPNHAQVICEETGLDLQRFMFETQQRISQAKDTFPSFDYRKVQTELQDLDKEVRSFSRGVTSMSKKNNKST